MDERQKRIVETLGLEQSEFEQNESTDTRIKDLTEAILELSEIIGGAE